MRAWGGFILESGRGFFARMPALPLAGRDSRMSLRPRSDFDSRSKQDCWMSRLNYSPYPHAGIAQLVEHLICNQGVTGSIPVAGTS